MIAPRTYVRYFLTPFLALVLAPSVLRAQCTSILVPLSETPVVDEGSWSPATVPPQMTVVVNTTIGTVGTTTATVPSTNGLEVGGTVEGPSVAPGTTVAAIVNGTTITLSDPSTGAGAGVPHTYGLAPYGPDVPPANTGVPASAHCSICPALFSTPICANNFAQMYMCMGNVYTVTLCGSVGQFNSTITVTNAAGNVSVAYDDDGCGVPDGLSTVTFTPTGSQLHRIRVFTDPCIIDAAACGTLEISCAPAPPPPANDEPWDEGSSTCTAVALPVSTTCTPFDASTAWATQSAGSPGCGAFVGMDVWFSAVVPASGDLSVQIMHESATDLAMALYTASACSGPMTLVPGSCNSDAGPFELAPFIGWSGLAAGSTVFIRVWPESGAIHSGTFTICAYEPTPPVNDDPCGSIDVPVTATCVPALYTTESASSLSPSMTLTPPQPTCGTPVIGGDVWFQVTIPASGFVVVSTQAGSLSDMAMAAYSLTAGSICGPGTLTQVPGACNDNATAEDLMPRLALSGNPGDVQYVRLWNRTSGIGTFWICATEGAGVVNDDPCAAIRLDVEHGCLFTLHTNEFATVTPTSSDQWASIPLPDAPCATPSPTSDVWFSAVVPENGEIRFDMDEGTLMDAAIAVYKIIGACETADLALTQSGCATTGSSNGPDMPALTVTDLTPGSTVYVRVWQESGTAGTFQLCASRTDAPPGTCIYTLDMTDADGDGWNGSTLTVCIDPSGPNEAVCTPYTVVGSIGSVAFGANVGDEVLVSYTAAGGGQGEIGYELHAPGGPLLDFDMFPPVGTNLLFTVTDDCNTPPPSTSDCVGATRICSNDDLGGNPDDSGNVNDLDATNRGCLATNEVQGEWYSMTVVTAGTLAFQISPPENQDYDFAMWGPYTDEVACPPANVPVRCSFSAVASSTGLNFTETDLSESAAGNSFVRYIDAVVGETYLLYVGNFTQGGVPFNIFFDPAMTASIDCLITGTGPTSVPATFNVHPNPASDRLAITGPFSTGAMDWQVLDASGRIVLMGRDAWTSGAPQAIAIDALERGSYMLRTRDAEGTTGAARFVKE